MRLGGGGRFRRESRAPTDCKASSQRRRPCRHGRSGPELQAARAARAAKCRNAGPASGGAAAPPQEILHAPDAPCRRHPSADDRMRTGEADDGGRAHRRRACRADHVHGAFRAGADGDFIGSTFLFMGAPDWARFGLMLADGGRFEGWQIVPADWAAASPPARRSRPGAIPHRHGSAPACLGRRPESRSRRASAASM
jgi:CubicO group peptidase (beta-lactamase class C family)